MPTLLLPSDFFDVTQPASPYDQEARAWEALGGTCAILPDPALGPKPFPQVHGTVVYRGWMQTTEEYRAMEQSVSEAGARLLTPTSAYAQGHHLPEWYATLQEHTPLSSWTTSLDETAILWALRQLPDGAAILKDYVKSLKHLWDSACYIPNVRDEAHALAICARFCEERGEVAGGLVFRSFETFVSEQARSWWVDGVLAAVSAHPDTPDRVGAVDLAAITPLVATLRLPFVTVDLVQNDQGVTRAIELGDGGVSGRPSSMAASELLQPLYAACV
jgi:hypothetical protein